MERGKAATIVCGTVANRARWLDTASVVFVVDDLAGWLVGVLADAGRKKLIGFIFGDEQERALRPAASAAVQQAPHDLSPAGDEQATQLAAAVRKALKKSELAAPLTGQVTLMEALHASIAVQLAMVDDTDLTGVGRSAAAVPGVSGAVVADRLTSYLVREITVRGSHGGPLAPLADQLNHDLTHLQGQRVESKLDRLLAQVQDALVLPGSDAAVAGRPLREVTDPFALEVHRPVQPEGLPREMRALPTYVPREHDTELGSVAWAATEGISGIAVLVGGSSTGKTRACWEALQLLRDQPESWRLWHPIDPSRPDAALRELPGIGPRTVVWLNEAQFYLDVEDGQLGERVAAGLRELLRDPARAPVLVLATLWPQFWDALTARPDGGTDPHAQARELLAGHDIAVPAAFTAAQLDQLTRERDTRLALAATGARDGQVTQFLAGAPELLARYRNAPPAAAALINAAMDARRLGMRAGLPRVFLEAAAPGYLTDTEWDALGEAWLEQALAYTAVPCKGVRGPLTRILPRPARPRPAGRGSGDRDDQPPSAQAGTAGGHLYRLADYLDQHGRAHRNNQIPPAEFWAAAADHAVPADQAALGDIAYHRGLYRAAAQLHKNAAAHGNLHAVFALSRQPRYLGADFRPLRWAAAHVPPDDPDAAARLLGTLRRAGAQEQAAALARRTATHAALDDPAAVARLLDALREADAQKQITVLADRAADRVPLNSPGDVAGVLDALRRAGAQEQAAALARRAATHAALDDPYAVARLLGALREADAREQITTLLRRDPAAHVTFGHPVAVAGLLGALREAGAHEQITTLADRAADRVPLDSPGDVASVLDSLRSAGAQEQVTALLRRDPAAHIPFGDPDPYWVAVLLDQLREAGAQEQVTTLADRAAAHAPLSDSHYVAVLLDSLRKAGAHEQVTILADCAAHAPLDHSRAVANLLDSLRKAGAQEQVTILAGRLPGAGMFELFCQVQGHQDQFRFGREADGSPTEPWGWEDLD